MTVEHKKLSSGKTGSSLTNLTMAGNTRSGLEYAAVATGKATYPTIVRKTVLDGVIESVIIEFPLNRASYDWLEEYCVVDPGEKFQVLLDDEVNQYFGAFNESHALILGRDYYIAAKARWLERKKANKTGNGNETSEKRGNQEQHQQLLPTVPAKVHLYRETYDWLVAFCKLARIDFLAFFTREINGYFDSFHGGEHVRSFRKAFVELLEDVGRLK
ncbi:MAG: hypothetical protein ACFFD4_19260 [Candidatus Odinarchaeota archaeon]